MLDPRARIIHSGKHDKTTGQAIMMAPVPLQAKDYEDGIQWGHLGDPKVALAKQEMCRAMQLYERFRAWLQPVRVKDKTFWAVCFPKAHPFKNGPVQSNPLDALLKNYVLNNRFPGRSPLDKGDGFNLLDIEKHNASSIEEEDKRATEVFL